MASIICDWALCLRWGDEKGFTQRRGDRRVFANTNDRRSSEGWSLSRFAG